jgi:hypothetical protein
MKRTYQVEIEIPDRFAQAEDWKVQNLIATMIEKATVYPQGEPHDRCHLKVTAIEKIAEEHTDPVTTFTNLLTDIFLNK